MRSVQHTVSVIIPARNEARHIRRCLESVLGQLPADELEVIVADGASSDATAELARAAGARVVANPARLTPTGLNRALAAAAGDVIVRFDAHGEMLPGYLRACLDALDDEPAAANVGGWCEPRGSAPWARATSAALASHFGVGNPRLWRRPPPGARREDVDTVHFGCWRAETLRDAGGWNNDYARNQDFELNLRLRRAGGRVIFDPAIGSIYYPRESFRGLLLQYWGYGVFKGKMFADDPESLRPRQLAPLVVLAAAVLSATPGRAGRMARAGMAGYGCVLAAVTTRGRGGWRTAPALAAMHLAWGGGATCELLRTRWTRLRGR